MPWSRRSSSVIATQSLLTDCCGRRWRPPASTVQPSSTARIAIPALPAKSWCKASIAVTSGAGAARVARAVGNGTGIDTLAVPSPCGAAPVAPGRDVEPQPVSAIAMPPVTKRRANLPNAMGVGYPAIALRS
ncbi:hypothetical protein SPHINGOT1_140004 [Sphingomonas sp. T1]|nr:hypothetical protein SPHINGOT1_140004 [Sphingomonas sp. T1]